MLYNIGYLSSESIKSTLDNAIENYRKTYPYKDRPSNLKYTEQAFKEAIDAYTELVDWVSIPILHFMMKRFIDWVLSIFS